MATRYATGRSSMEITLQIAKAPKAATNTEQYIPEAIRPEDVFITCAFTMVSLDPVTMKPVNIAPLILSTPEERALYAKGEENHKAKKALKALNIMQKAPDAEESALIHKMWTDSVAYADSKNPANKPSNMTFMSKSTIHSAQIMQPQYRNRHNFMIFGGYLLKHTFELAFTCAASFSHARPTFINLDPSTFEAPVPVGSVLYISAGISYTELDSAVGGTRIQVMVRTQVRNVEHSENERKSTGTFFYTFHVDTDVSVLPQSYSEFMRWIDGRRRAQRLAQNLEDDAKEGGRMSVLGGHGAERVTE
jgi:acyl-coenzyme A thioesterase 9